MVFCTVKKFLKQRDATLICTGLKLCTVFFGTPGISLVYILASSHPHILRFLCTCLYLHILTSFYSQTYVLSLASLHPHIFTLVCACLQRRIIKSPYPQVHLLCVPVSILATSHPHILRGMYCRCLLVSHILTSLYAQVDVPSLASLHRHMLTFVCVCL